MKILALDDERLSLDVLVMAIQKAAPLAEVYSFMNASVALSFLRTNPMDVAFLDIEMPECNGIKVAYEIKKLHPTTNIIFVTGYESYQSEAFRLHASGYLLKPVLAEDVEMELQELRYPVEKKLAGVFIKTFGNFEIFKEGKPLSLGDRSKELLAYLVDRAGSTVTNGELYTILYEGRSGHEEAFKKTKKALLEGLKHADVSEILVQQWGRMAIDCNKVSCDLFDYRKGIPLAINQYLGEYMAQYSWAEQSANNPSFLLKE